MNPSKAPRVLVTRPEGDDGPLSRALRAVGAEPVVAPAFSYAPMKFDGPGPDWTSYDWVAWTSAVAVDALAPPRSQARHAAVGASTAAALERLGIEVAVVGERGAAGLADDLMKRLRSGDRLLYPRSNRADSGFATRLRQAGVMVDDPVAYRIEPVDPEEIRSALASGPSAVTFASPSAVRGTAEALARQQTAGAPLAGTVLASIGPTTTATLSELLRAPDVVASVPAFGALARAVADALGLAGQDGEDHG